MKKTLLALLVVSIVVVFAGLLGTNFGPRTLPTLESASPMMTPNPSTNGTQPPANVPTQTTLTGEYVCLPHRDTSGPVTMECAFGLKATNGSHYALDTSTIPQDSIISLPTGKEITVEGTLVPIEQISSNTWQKYNIVGIVKVSSIE